MPARIHIISLLLVTWLPLVDNEPRDGILESTEVYKLEGNGSSSVVLLVNSTDSEDMELTSSEAAELVHVMSLTDVLLMFFFISGLVINLLAFFIAFIVFWNTPVIKAYVSNMITADLMLLVTGFYLKFKSVFKIISNTFCKAIFTTDIALLHVSCYTIVLIAFYRYCKLFPVRVLGSPASSLFAKPFYRKLSLLAVWTVPIAIASPMLFFAGYDEEFNKCYSAMPYDFQTFYNVLTFATSYLLPGIVVTFVYSRIIFKTRSAVTLSNSTIDNSSQVNMMRFLSYVVSAFWLLHLPFWTCNLSSTFGLFECSRSVLHLSIVLTYFNAALNPFLYALLSVDCARCSCAWLTESCLCEPVRCLIFLFCSCDSGTSESSSTHSNPDNDNENKQDGGDLGDGVFPTSFRTREAKSDRNMPINNNNNCNNNRLQPISYQALQARQVDFA